MTLTDRPSLPGRRLDHITARPSLPAIRFELHRRWILARAGKSRFFKGFWLFKVFFKPDLSSSCVEDTRATR